MRLIHNMCYQALRYVGLCSIEEQRFLSISQTASENLSREFYSGYAIKSISLPLIMSNVRSKINEKNSNMP